MKKQFFKTMLFILAILGLIFARCKKDEKNITIVLDWIVNTNHTGIYVAQDLGYFNDQGLSVSIEYPPETGAANMVLAGQAEFFVSYQEEITLSRTAGKDLVALAAVIQHNTSGFASRKEKNITRPKDFEGKTYGGWGSPMEEAVLKALMEKDGADYSKMKNISIGSINFFAATKNKIDFVWIYEKWDGIMAKIKNIDIYYIPMAEIEKPLDYYTPVIATTESYIKNNNTSVKKFMKALAKGYNYSINEPDKAAEILLKNTPELNRELVFASQKFLSGKYREDAPFWGFMKEAVWKDFASWMKQCGLLDKNVDIGNAFTNEFLPVK